jgi:hypothetical protein
VEAVRVGRFRISLEGLGLAVLALALVLSVTRCNAMRDGLDAERLAQLEGNAYKSSLANIAARRTTDSVLRATDVERKRVVNLVAANRKLSAQLGAVLDANDSLLRLPPDSTDVLLLRLQLAKTTEVARLFRDSTDVLITQVVTMLSAHEAERQAWLAERAMSDLTLSAERRISQHLRKQARCRVLGVPCVKRSTAYLGGILTGLLLVSVL